MAGVLEPLRKLVGEKRLRRVRLEDAMQSLLRGGRAVLDLGQRRQPCRRYAGGTRRFLELTREDLEGCAYLLFAVSGRRQGHELLIHPKASPAVDRSEAHTSEEHTSELQSLMRLSYAVLC